MYGQVPDIEDRINNIENRVRHGGSSALQVREMLGWIM